MNAFVFVVFLENACPCCGFVVTECDSLVSIERIDKHVNLYALICVLKLNMNEVKLCMILQIKSISFFNR